MNQITVQTNDILTIIDTANLADTTKSQYKKAIQNALNSGINLADSEQLASYATTLKTSSKAFLKAAIKLWSNGLAMQAKSQAAPENVQAVQATIYRAEALQNAISVEATTGEKLHIWLSQAEVKKLLKTCNKRTMKCKRDRLVLGLLVGAGLRRAELAQLTFDDIQTQSVKNKKRTVLNVRGKGAKDRIIPISKDLASLINDFGKYVGHAGNIARSISKSGKIGETLSPIGIYTVVNNAGKKIDKPELAPHDLRRTFAQIGYEAGVPITQISKLLGHSSIATTQRYLNLDLDLETTISDFVPLA